MSAETENSVSTALNFEKCSVVLLDVAGTTTSINFVKETLFPYVTKKAEEYLKSHWEDNIVKESVKLLKDSEVTLTDALAAVKELTEQNSENKGLKAIQGLIYKEGYENGDLKAHVFPDVPTSLEAWTKSKKIAIYSTGSVESQQLLFSHTTEGDISAHINKYFDQNIGGKTDSQSYENIAKEFEVEKGEILFITDNIEEAKAAKTSGMLAVLVNREGNESFPEEIRNEFSIISSFKDITFENPAKRKNEDETVPKEVEPPAKIAKKDVSSETPAVAEVPVPDSKTEDKMEDEKMEVDDAVEKEQGTAKAKSEDKLAEAPSENEKTEINSAEKKTDGKTDDSVNKNVESKETAVTETPMETSDDNCKKDENKQETDEKKEKNTEESKDKKCTEKSKEPIKEKSKPESIEKMESEADITEPKKNVIEKELVKESVCEKTKAEATNVTEKVVGATDEKIVCAVEEKAVDTEDKEKKTNVSASDKDIAKSKETVDSESSVCKKDEDKIAVVEEKVVEKKGDKVQVSPPVMEEKSVEEKPNAVEEKPTGENSEMVDKAKNGEESKCDENTKIEDNAQEKKPVIEKKLDEEMASSSESCKKEKVVEPVLEQENKTEERADSENNDEKPIEEKENKSELANGIENGQTETKVAVNGDSEEKASDDLKVNDAEKVEEIKVKKVEDSADSTPPVSVEV